MSIEKSTKAARGTVQCENTNINLLKANDFVASCKTTLMQQTAERLKDKLTMAVMVGDLETERDAERIRETGIQALQIVTGGICHLEAQMIHQVLPEYKLEDIDLLFIENVGNLVCPASFDLGEDFRVTLMATTEGDDKPKKYPRMFLTSDMMLVSKSDLLPYVPFSVEAVTNDAHEVNHELEVIQISSINGEGMDAWCDWLVEKVNAKNGV